MQWSCSSSGTWVIPLAGLQRASGDELAIEERKRVENEDRFKNKQEKKNNKKAVTVFITTTVVMFTFQPPPKAKCRSLYLSNKPMLVWTDVTFLACHILSFLVLEP